MSITDLAQYKKESVSRFRSLEEWLAWQEKLHFTAIELGLDRCRKVADKMHLLPPSYFVVSIAGTNGKGSCAVMLENILKESGYKVGLYTSPHLLRYNERISLSGQEVSDTMLCNSFTRIDKARGSISLTYFEFGTLAAMDIFQKNDVDIAIMEVGMGGRLDAVNMLDANVALISTIDIDHEKWLGNDRESIGMEKSGIFRSMRPAICADPKPPQSIYETANLVGANLLISGIDFKHEISDNSWSWQSGDMQYQNLPIPGQHSYQVENASGVLVVLQKIADHFPVEQEAVVKGMKNFRLPGRFQVVPGEIPLIFDVAHNRQSASILAANLSKLPGTGNTVLVLGMLKDKNHAAFMKELAPYIDNWYLATQDDSRGANSRDLAAILRTINSDAVISEFDDLGSALKCARSVTGIGDRLIITGSFVIVGAALNIFGIE